MHASEDVARFAARRNGSTPGSNAMHVALSAGSPSNNRCNAAVTVGEHRMATETIYVYLFDEGVDCWRPIEAVHEGEDRYRIVSVNPNPEDEHWEFSAGDLVVCERRRFAEGEGLVAVRRA